MKKLVLIASLCAAFAAVAKPVELMSVKFADVTKVSKAAGCLGEAMGQRSIGAVVAASLASNPYVAAFGPMRDNAQLGIVVYGDDSVSNAVGMADLEGIDLAAVYPLSKDKATLMKSLSAVETNGFCCVGGECENGSELENVCFKFSDDGKWLVLGAKKEIIDLAMAKIGYVAEPLADSVCEASVTHESFGLIANTLEAAMPEEKESIEVIRSVDGYRLALDVNERGLFARAFIKPHAGSDLSKIGKVALASAPLAFAPTNALIACEYAANGGQPDYLAMFEKIAKLVVKNDIDYSSVSIDRDSERLGLSIDLKAMLAYGSGASTNSLSKLDPQTFVAAVKEIVDTKGICVKAPPFAGYIALKDHPAASSPAVRFNSILAAGKSRPAFHRSVFSLYSIIRALEPTLMSVLDEQERAALKPFVAQLPKEGPGGIAVESWRENDELCVEMGVSPDEIAGLSACVNAGMTYYMFQQMSAVSCEDDDDSDDEADAECDTDKKCDVDKKCDADKEGNANGK